VGGLFFNVNVGRMMWIWPSMITSITKSRLDLQLLAIEITPMVAKDPGMIVETTTTAPSLVPGLLEGVIEGDMRGAIAVIEAIVQGEVAVGVVKDIEIEDLEAEVMVEMRDIEAVETIEIEAIVGVEAGGEVEVVVWKEIIETIETEIIETWADLKVLIGQIKSNVEVFLLRKIISGGIRVSDNCKEYPVECNVAAVEGCV
jgi:hypothetical protein